MFDMLSRGRTVRDMNVIVILCDTLRRDHCSAYTDGKPLNQCWSGEAPSWSVPTPNMQRLAARGTVFDNAWCGSTPCMPARRDIYTGRYEFLERGWGPLEEDDLDLPRQVSGPPNESITAMQATDYRVSQLITDHFHLWEQGSGNYHMGYTGFEFVRGAESDGYRTDPIEFDCPPGELHGKTERHWRNVHFIRQDESDWFCAQVFSKAADWLRRNRTHKDFYLHLDCFDPHEPWDPPEELLKMFWPDGYDVDFDWVSAGPYALWRGNVTEQQFEFTRARYAAKVVLVDRWLGRLLDAMDELDLWEDTLVIFTTDHGTFNGDHGRLGKSLTHQYDALAHIPLITCHPQFGHGQRRDQIVQLVDIYPTVLSAVNRPLPTLPDDKPLHGINLLPVLEDADCATRPHAVTGHFGKSTSITDGRWILHQSPGPDNQPLHWYGYCLSKFLPGYDLGPYHDGRRQTTTESWPTSTWLSDKRNDPNELVNLADSQPDQLRRMQTALKQTLMDLKSPPEQIKRLGLS